MSLHYLAMASRFHNWRAARRVLAFHHSQPANLTPNVQPHVPVAVLGRRFAFAAAHSYFRAVATVARPRARGLLVAFAVLVALSLIFSNAGMAQTGGTDPLSALRSMGGSSGGIGSILSGVGGNSVDTTASGPQSQTLQPQFTSPRLQPPSRLEQILSGRAGIRLTQFGYDQFGVGRQVQVPETGAVADDYILGPGDQLTITLRGQENTDVRTTVDRDGRVVLPRMAPIAATGRTFGTFVKDVDRAVSSAYVATNATVSLGRVRQVSVLVSGEVMMPGVRLVTGLSSVIDAVLLSGGIKKTGSLRDVRILRGGREIAIDLYSALNGAGNSAATRLADGDRILVPPLGATAAIAGLVRRPGIYELPPHGKNISAQALLGLAGGQEVQGRYRFSLQRIDSDGHLTLVALQNLNTPVHDSEILRIELNGDRAQDQATLSGATGLSGNYAVAQGSKLSDILRSPGALGANPYTLFGLIVRTNPQTLQRSLLPFTPAAVMRGAEDISLQSNDVVRPISLGEAELLSYIVKTYLDKLNYDQNRVRNPLDTTRADAAAAMQAASGGAAAAAAGQLAGNNSVSPNNPFGLQPGQLESDNFNLDDFSGVPTDLQRSDIVALLNVAAPGTPFADQREAAYQQALATATSGPNAASSPAQMAQAQQSALAMAQTGVVATDAISGGYSAYPMGAGQYRNQGGPNEMSSLNGFGGLNSGQGGSMTNGPAVPAFPNQPPNANFEDQPSTPGSYASNQEVHTFGQLVRQLGIDPLVLVNFLIDYRIKLDGAVRGPGTYFVGGSATLQDVVEAAGGTVKWADESGVELLSTATDTAAGSSESQDQILPLHKGTLASYVVRPRDYFHFNKVYSQTGIGSITVQGEVRFPGNYPLVRGEHLSEVLMKVGGLTPTAYPSGTVFLRRSAAKVEQDGYNRAADQIQTQLLAGMARVGNDKIPAETFTAMQAFVTQLRTQKALGRITTVADPSVLAANPALDPLLEAGDVVFIPQRPSTVAVLGEVMQPGSYSYRPGMSVADFIKEAGGDAQFSDDDMIFVVDPDGRAHRIESSWFSYDAPKLRPGSSIVVPRNLTPIDTRQMILDVTGIFSSLAVALASLAVISSNN